MHVCTHTHSVMGADLGSGAVVGNGFTAVSRTSYGPCLSRAHILAMERENFSIPTSASKTGSILQEILEKSKSAVLVSSGNYNRIPQTKWLK